MKVLIVSTSERVGGAAVAANRLMKALNKNGVKARMLVNNKITADPEVLEVPGKWRKKYNFIFERFLIFLLNAFSRKRLFDIDPSFTGSDITRLDCFKEADVIHLHWINQGMLSLRDLRKVLRSGKPVVWTMHDQWASTGICHSTGDCVAFRQACGLCPLLAHRRKKDLSNRVFLRKKDMNRQHPVLYVTCSHWLESNVMSSGIMETQKVTAIPNPIDVASFKPLLKSDCRALCRLPLDKKLVLVGAVKVTDWRKGFDYMVKAFARLGELRPDLMQRFEIVAIGDGASSIQAVVPFVVNGYDYVSSEEDLVRLYNAVDFFFTPSLFENLPNMIMEAMACGVPCIGFEVGGIPEMIDHKRNGYVARYKDVDDLVSGISWLLALSDAEYAGMARACRDKVEKQYSEEKIAGSYRDIYEYVLQKNIAEAN